MELSRAHACTGATGLVVEAEYGWVLAVVRTGTDTPVARMGRKAAVDKAAETDSWIEVRCSLHVWYGVFVLP